MSDVQMQSSEPADEFVPQTDPLALGFDTSEGRMARAIVILGTLLAMVGTTLTALQKENLIDGKAAWVHITMIVVGALTALISQIVHTRGRLDLKKQILDTQVQDLLAEIRRQASASVSAPTPKPILSPTPAPTSSPTPTSPIVATLLCLGLATFAMPAQAQEAHQQTIWEAVSPRPAPVGHALYAIPAGPSFFMPGLSAGFGLNLRELSSSGLNQMAVLGLNVGNVGTHPIALGFALGPTEGVLLPGIPVGSGYGILLSTELARVGSDVRVDLGVGPQWVTGGLKSSIQPTVQIVFYKLLPQS